ncbi:unnamed protein product, partial [Vitis vinifera]|uniref:Uncharacterized protein n=1 Tax=Vitis vinifera TaxID=29760 RepID=D7U191_VITVI
MIFSLSLKGTADSFANPLTFSISSSTNLCTRNQMEQILGSSSLSKV